MTTAHVSAAILEGPPPTVSELLAGLEHVLQRHPMLAACVRGKSKYHVPNAQPYPMHSDYLGRAFAYTKELMRTYPDEDIQRFEPSPLPPSELARRALTVVALPSGESTDVEEALEAAWRAGFSEAMVGPVNKDQFSIVARASLSQNYDGVVLHVSGGDACRNGPFDHVVTFHRA